MSVQSYHENLNTFISYMPFIGIVKSGYDVFHYVFAWSNQLKTEIPQIESEVKILASRNLANMKSYINMETLDDFRSVKEENDSLITEIDRYENWIIEKTKIKGDASLAATRGIGSSLLSMTSVIAMFALGIFNAEQLFLPFIIGANGWFFHTISYYSITNDTKSISRTNILYTFQKIEMIASQ